MPKKCDTIEIDGFTFSLQQGSDTIIVFRGDTIADRSVYSTTEKAKETFDQLKNYKKVIFVPEGVTFLKRQCIGEEYTNRNCTYKLCKAYEECHKKSLLKLSHKIREIIPIPCEVSGMGDCPFGNSEDFCCVFPDPDECPKYRRILVLEGEIKFAGWEANPFKLDYETLTFFYIHVVEGKCVDCGQKFPYQGCPEGFCPKCGKECHERVMDSEDGGEWDTCDYNCPYGPKDDEINYEQLEKDYPTPSDEEIKKSLAEQ